MTTIKSYTDIEQSRKLAEILPLESADMCLTFVNNVWNPVWGKADDIYQLQKDCYEPDYTKDDYVDIDEFEPKVVPCWSLSALMELMNRNCYNVSLNCHSAEWNVKFDDSEKYKDFIKDYAVDAAYEMVVWLKENKKI